VSEITELPWQPIESAPRVDMATYLGYDEHTAKLHGDPTAGLCLITWMDEEDIEDEDDYVPAGWQVQPFGEGLDSVDDDRTSVTMWCPLTALLPKVVRS